MTEYLTIGQIADRYGVTILTIRRWWYTGRFPKPIIIGKVLIRWRQSDIEQYDRSRESDTLPERERCPA